MRLLPVLFVLIGSLDAQAVDYFAGTYPADHWALQYPVKTDEGFVARFTFRSHAYAAVVHPLDSRGYRSLVLRVAPDMASTINRAYTLEEKQGLYRAMGVVAEAYEALDLIAQLEVLGNNAHVFDPNTCHLKLGSAHEPSILHGHVIGRGNPAGEFVTGVALKGPPPGEIFDVRAKQPGVWADGDRATVARAIADQLRQISSRDAWVFADDLRLDEIR